MCGIAGFAGEGNRQVLEKMAQALAHRGPDDSGTFFAHAVGFAHTRLSVIDLSPFGHQPMESASGSTVIIFNGEIYNFKELRAEIERIGKYTFLSNSDTEVILALYEEIGEEVFSRLDGMFAIALYDKKEEKVFLVRDRLGKKPLYWGMVRNTLLFGSEIKALMCHDSWKGDIDLESLNSYIACEYVPTPQSIFKGIYKLQPASYLVWRNSQVEKIVEFWKPEKSQRHPSLEEAANKLDVLLEKSVTERLIADVPLGIFLSGGLDSSTVAYYAKQGSTSKVQTFSVGFENQSFDESHKALEVARFLGTDHHTEIFSVRQSLELIPKIFSLLDEPLADPSILPTHLLSLFTRKHVTVALGGDGADELFAGYQTFQAEALFKQYQKLPNILKRNILEPLIKKIPVSHSYMSLDFRLKKFLEGTEAGDKYRHQHWLNAFSDEERLSLFSPDVRGEISKKNPYAFVDQYWNTSSQTDFYQKLLFVYLRTYLMDQVMVKVDRASMAHALEVRSPFLDYHVVDYMSSLPYEFKFRNFSGKYLLRELMKNKLPRSIVYRKKQGFSVPIGIWLKKELRPLCEELLSKDSIQKIKLFDPQTIEILKKEHFAGIRDNRKKLWTLMVFVLWHNKFFSRY